MTSQIILSSYRRPANVKRILERIAEQSVPFDRIVVVDNGYTDGYGIELPQPTNVQLWRFPDDGVGPPCRFVPALISHRYTYTLFLDDDLLPGIRMHEHLLNTASALQNQFSTLGEIGRRYPFKSEWVYRIADVRRHEQPVAIDLTCRAHFVLTRNIHKVLVLRDDLMDTFGTGEDWLIHDDILLNCALQIHTSEPSYLTAYVSRDHNIESEKLPEPFAVHKRVGHVTSRQKLINLAAALGWRSLVT